MVDDLESAYCSANLVLEDTWNIADFSVEDWMQALEIEVLRSLHIPESSPTHKARGAVLLHSASPWCTWPLHPQGGTSS